MFHSVHAEANSKESKKVKVSELSIYDNPEDKYEVHVYEEENTTFKKGVTEFRKGLFSFLDNFKETTDYVKEKVEIGRAHAQSSVEYIKSDPGLLPRVGVIAVAGLGGVVAGHRGGFVRKAFYSTFAMVGAAALCYPNQAVELTTDTYNKAVDHAKSLWQSPEKGKGQKSD